MLHLASCLLLVASALATHRVPYTGIHGHIRPPNYAGSGSFYPIDFEDELTIRNPLVRPDTNIVFSFTQARIDEPPQVDTREEKLERYMYRNPPSTTTSATTATTSAPSKATAKAKESSESEESMESSEIRETQPISSQRLEQRLIRPVMLPTGTTTRVPYFPNFRDFSSDLVIPDSSRINYAARYPPVDIWPRLNQPSTPIFNDDQSQNTERQTTIEEISSTTTQPQVTEDTTTSQPQVTEVTSKVEPASHSKIEQTEPLSVIVVEEEPVSTTELDVTVAPPTTQPSASYRRPHKSRHINRGSVKFNWADVKSDAAEPTPVASAPIVPTVPAALPNVVPLKLLGPPPPVPTLTPWMGDDF